MYLIIVDGADFAISNNPATCILDGQVHTKKNAIDTFEMTLAPNHLNDNLIELRKSIIEVRVGSSVAELRNTNSTVFVGIPVDVTEDFYKQKTYTFEGWMSLLSQTIQPYIAYQKSGNGGTPWTAGDILNNLLANHNGQLDSSNKYDFELVDAPAGIDNFGMTTADGCTTLEAISMLLDGNGGYLHATYDSTATKPFKLAWMDDDSAIRTNTQKIEFGSNLLDLSKQLDRVKPYTAVAPLTVTGIEGTIGKGKGKTQVKYGLKMYYDSVSPRPADLKKLSAKDSGHSLTSDYKRDLYYVYDQQAVDKYGLNIFIYNFDDIDVESLADIMASGEKMYKRAKKKLKKLLKKGVDNIYLKTAAIDLSVTGANVTAIKLFDSVTMTSTPHGISQVAMITERDYDLCNPENDAIVFGEDSSSTITSASTTPSKSVTKYVNQKINDIATTIEEGGGDGKDEVSDGTFNDLKNPITFTYVDGAVEANPSEDKLYIYRDEKKSGVSYEDLIPFQVATQVSEQDAPLILYRSIDKDDIPLPNYPSNRLRLIDTEFLTIYNTSVVEEYDENGELLLRYTAIQESIYYVHQKMHDTHQGIDMQYITYPYTSDSPYTKQDENQTSGYPIGLQEARSILFEEDVTGNSYYNWNRTVTNPDSTKNVDTMDTTSMYMLDFIFLVGIDAGTFPEGEKINTDISSDIFGSAYREKTPYGVTTKTKYIIDVDANGKMTGIPTYTEVSRVNYLKADAPIIKTPSYQVHKVLTTNSTGDKILKRTTTTIYTITRDIGSMSQLVQSRLNAEITYVGAVGNSSIDYYAPAVSTQLKSDPYSLYFHEGQKIYSSASARFAPYHYSEALQKYVPLDTSTIVFEGLSKVAKSGSYLDLKHRPLIPKTVKELVDSDEYIRAEDVDYYVGKSTAFNNYYTKPEVDALTQDINHYQGTISALSGLSTNAKKGWFYRVDTAWATNLHVGDVIIAEKDNPAQTIDGANWSLLHNEMDTDTTYTFTGGTNSFSVTPSGGTAQKVSITPKLSQAGSSDHPIYVDANGNLQIASTFKTYTGGGQVWTEYGTSAIRYHDPGTDLTQYLPSKSGTFALTSDIPDVTQYLPLAGGTMDAGASIKFQDSDGKKYSEPNNTRFRITEEIVDESGTDTTYSTSYERTFIRRSTTSGSGGSTRRLYFPDKQGTLALTSDIPDVSGLATKDEVEDVADEIKNYLPLSAGQNSPLTDSIWYQGSKSKNAALTFLDNTIDAYGNGVALGAGGITIVGAGESPLNLYNDIISRGLATTATESLMLAADDSINLEANCNNISERLGIRITSAGNIYPTKNGQATNDLMNLGLNGYEYLNVYTKNIHGALQNQYTVRSAGTNNYNWHRIAGVPVVTNNYQDKDLILMIRQVTNLGKLGIIKFSFRSTTIESGTATGVVAAEWIIRKGYNLDDIKVAIYEENGTPGKMYADVYFKAGTYGRTGLTILGNSSVINNIPADANGASDWSVNSTDDKNNPSANMYAYASIEDGGQALHGQAYTSIVDSTDGGTIVSRAISDKNGNIIDSNYQRKTALEIDAGASITTLGVGLYSSKDAAKTSTLTGLPPGLKYGFLLEIMSTAIGIKCYRITENPTTVGSSIYYKRSDSAQWTKFAGTLV